MKRVGLIDNLSDIDTLLPRFCDATAAEVMAATGGNTGNVAYVYGARQILANPLTRVGWAWDPKVVRETFDQLVICCANQIGGHADLGGWADRIEQFNLPVVLLGLGAQSDSVDQVPEVPEGTRKFLEVVNGHRADAGCENIAVRGGYTKSVLSGLGTQSVAAGCPSLHISQRQELGKFIFESQSTGCSRVAVAAGNPWHAASAPLEPALVEIVDRYAGEYVIQHPTSMLQVAYGERPEGVAKTETRFLEVYRGRFSLGEMYDWYRRNGIAFVDAPNWMRFLKKFDLVLGPRYHGVALALQSEIPGCVVTIDGRTQELCDGTAVKSIELVDALQLSADDLVEASRWTKDDAARFDANRAGKARVFVDYLEANGLSCSAQLSDLAS